MNVNLYFAVLDRIATQPYTEIVDSWREAPAGLLGSRKDLLISVSKWTRRILPDGFSFSLFVHTAAEWLADFADSFFAFWDHSPRLAADFLHAVSLVLPGHLSGPAGGEDVLCDR